MNTEVAVDGIKFLLNGKPTYEGITHFGKPIEGLLMNSRMVQAIFDDECPETRKLWRYPDTGVWDPDRNTDEFCAMLPVYRDHGLLAVTVCLQGGCSINDAEVYDHYLNSAFSPDGEFKQPYFDRMLRVIQAADEAGMAVIASYFYWKQVLRIPEDRTLYELTEKVTDWLLHTGYRNILVDIANESAPWWKRPVMEPDQIHKVIDIAKQTTLNGRRLLIGVSTGGNEQLPTPKWLESEDITMPHGNECTMDGLRTKLRKLKEMDEYRKRPRPILINEDSIFVENMEAAIDEYASWGFYDQGYGSGVRDRMNWQEHGREETFEALSGYQTIPVNWGINSPEKKAFFTTLKAITSGFTP